MTLCGNIYKNDSRKTVPDGDNWKLNNLGDDNHRYLNIVTVKVKLIMTVGIKLMQLTMTAVCYSPVAEDYRCVYQSYVAEDTVSDGII